MHTMPYEMHVYQHIVYNTESTPVFTGKAYSKSITTKLNAIHLFIYHRFWMHARFTIHWACARSHIRSPSLSLLSFSSLLLFFSSSTSPSNGISIHNNILSECAVWANGTDVCRRRHHRSRCFFSIFFSSVVNMCVKSSDEIIGN